jgi:hypothetical protein
MKKGRRLLVVIGAFALFDWFIARAAYRQHYEKGDYNVMVQKNGSEKNSYVRKKIGML